MTLDAAKREHRVIERKLARKISYDYNGEGINTQEHWRDVGRYHVLEEILCEADKE